MIAIGIHHGSRRAELEGPGASIGQIAIWLPDLEEAPALYDGIHRVVCLRKVALGEDDLVTCGAGTETQLEARGNHGLRPG